MTSYTDGLHDLEPGKKAPRLVRGRAGSLLLCFSHDKSLAGGATPILGGCATPILADRTP